MGYVQSHTEKMAFHFTHFAKERENITAQTRSQMSMFKIEEENATERQSSRTIYSQHFPVLHACKCKRLKQDIYKKSFSFLLPVVWLLTTHYVHNFLGTFFLLSVHFRTKPNLRDAHKDFISSALRLPRRSK